MEIDGSLSCSQDLATGPCFETDESSPHPLPYFFKIHFLLLGRFKESVKSEAMVTFRNRLIFYCEELSASRPTIMVEDRPCRMSMAAYSIYLLLLSIPLRSYLEEIVAAPVKKTETNDRRDPLR
jgi:hypothetical protein